VQKDYVQAYMWYTLGAATGVKAGAVMWDELAVQMTSEQLLAAKKLVREWKPKPYERPTH
jgi:hypothetical protein